MKEYLVLETPQEFSRFLESVKGHRNDFVEHKVMSSFAKNKILFTAEHAYYFRMPTPLLSKESYVGIGDTNTDKMAKIMAARLKSAYITFNLPRTDIDASRPISRIGKEDLLVAAMDRGELLEKIRIPIHQNSSYVPNLRLYHNTIKRLSPTGLVSVHGIHKRHKSDFIFGFGRDYRYIDGEDNAKEIVRLVERKIRGTIAENLVIRIGRKFTGEKNNILSTFVGKLNEENKERRFGFQVEANSRGRVTNDRTVSKEYQIAIQAIADVVLEWSKRKA